jgi:hypothetical protein
MAKHCKELEGEYVCPTLYLGEVLNLGPEGILMYVSMYNLIKSELVYFVFHDCCSCSLWADSCSANQEFPCFL